MKKTVRGFITLFIVTALALCTCFSIAFAAESDNPSLETGQMELDVMFVLDASGSMLTSDPNKVALDAINLFVDLSDETCGAGYVVYTEKIKAYSDIVSFENKSDVDAFKKKVSSLKYDPNGDTDISLGLTKAMKTFEKKGDANGRKRAIILLSDGNTHLNGSTRTVQDSKKEMEDTLLSLSRMDIPVFAIGLNYDGTLDKKEIQRIATATEGKSFSTKTSDELPTILTQIFSEIYDIKGKELSLVNGFVRVKVENSSIFYVNIIIKSKFNVKQLNPRLVSPQKEDVPIEGSENIKVTSAGNYTLIKMIYPQVGDWKLYLDKVTEDNCRITQLDFYSVYIKQNLAKEAGIRQPYTIEASLNEGDVVVRDFALLDTITMVSTVTTASGEQKVELKCNEYGIFTGQFTPTELGEFTVVTKAKTKAFEKEGRTFKGTVVESVATDDQSSFLIESEEDDNGSGFVMAILTYVGIGVLAVVVIIVIILVIIGIIKAKAQKDTVERPAPPPPPPPPPEPAPAPKPVYIPEPPAPKQPEAKPPEYVDVPLLEHAPLEELIKRGSDNSFNKTADQFETDKELEKLVKKGNDDAFNMNSADSYEVDPSLAALIKTGGNGLEGQGIQKEEPQEDPEEE